jgi:hypothetical protein
MNEEMSKFEIELTKQLKTFHLSKKKEKDPQYLRILAISHRMADVFDKVSKQTDVVVALLRIEEKLQKTKEKETKLNVTLLRLVKFLWTYEVCYMFCVDMTCYYLIANGHDLFDSFKRKYAVTFEEIGNVDASTKLKFLESHNFKLFNREQDRKLRNKIAHHDFSISDSGILKIDGVEVDIASRAKALIGFSNDIMDSFNRCLDEVLSKKS